MDEKLVKRPITTIVTMGKGQNKAIVVGKTQVLSETGRVAGANMVDIAFVFDTTGSMSDKISALLETCAGFVDEAGKMKLNPQFSLISFGDLSVQGGGDRIEVVVPPTQNIEKIKYGLKNIPRNNGFGNTGESVLEAIDEAFKLQYRDKAVKVMIVITDEPALQWETKVARTISTMTQREFLVFVVATNENYYREMAIKNGGVWKEIGPNTDFAEILRMFNEMAKKVTQIAKSVHLIGKGSVKEYLKLTSPK